MPEATAQTPMKLTVWGNEDAFIAMGVFSSFRRYIFLKINSRESSSNNYLWIINVQKESQIHLKSPPDITSGPTELDACVTS
jgi:hypothetical protein